MDKLDIELKEHKHIVFCEDHYNPLNVIRSLGEKGISTYVILVAEAPVLINHCKYTQKVHQVSSREEGYRILIDKYSKEDKKPFLYCSDDTTMCFLDKHFDELIDKFYFYNSGEKGRIEWLQNKDNITNLGTEVGLESPKKEIVDTGVLPTTLNYPILTKVLASTMGAWKNDVYICNNENELKEAYTKIKSPKLIIQEYINKIGEFCMEGFSINNGQEIFIPYIADYIRYYNNSYGHYMNMIPFEECELKEKIKKLLKLTKFNGIFEIEFMKGPDGKNYFLEVNFRASTWNYALTVGGGNLPYYWAKSTLAGRILYEEMNLKKDIFKAMVEPEDLILNVFINKKVKLSQWIKDVKSCECLYYYNKNDKSPFFHYINRRLWTSVKRKLRIL